MTLDVTYTHPGLDLEPDLSEVDAAFDPDSVEVEGLGSGKHRVTYPVLSQVDQELGKVLLNASFRYDFEDSAQVCR